MIDLPRSARILYPVLTMEISDLNLTYSMFPLDVMAAGT